jgi:Kef-type K+ transport system membrane component KefB
VNDGCPFPSLLGRISPDGMDLLFPTRIMPFLSVLAQLGVILYMFLVGLELNSELLRSRAAATLAISNASIIAPFLLGAILALWLFPGFAPAGVPFSSFAMMVLMALVTTVITTPILRWLHPAA